MTASLLPNVSPEDQHFLLDGMGWSEYEAMLDAVGNCHVFLTYDRGRAELMSPSYEHENRSELISKMIWAVCDGLNQPLKAGGSTTFRREDLQRGLEPDKCFWVSHEKTVRLKQSIDLSLDPPPDLCVEIEISQRLLDRIGIYANLGVPELWRDNGRLLRIYTLSAERKYVEASVSVAFPTITAVRLNRYLAKSVGLDETTWARKVRRAVRKLRS